MKLEKVYAVEFCRYTNALNDTISDWDGKSSDIGKTKYLNVGNEVFLVKESDLQKYNKYGGGYRNISLVGMMEVEE